MPFDLEPAAEPPLAAASLTPLRAPATPSEGALISPPIPVPAFDRAVLSWNAEGRWRFELRARVGLEWSPWRIMGHMEDARQRSEPAPTRPDPSARVAVETDTLVVKGAAKAGAFQVRVSGRGTIRALCVAHYCRRGESAYTGAPAVAGAWGVVLPVPERSQGSVGDPAIRSRVCGPTSLGMVLAYYGRSIPTLDLARAVYDPVADAFGNWPINTAVAARMLAPRGRAAVVKLPGFAAVEQEIAAGRPVILSHNWRRGELSGAPVSGSAGHLIVAVGFTPGGDVVVNDPAARPGQVRRVYRRAELFGTWQNNGGGVAYLIRAD